MGHLINGRRCMLYSTAVLNAGTDNIPAGDEYLILIPQQSDERVVGFVPFDEMDELNWLMEVANGDPAQNKDILLIGGAPAQSPPQIILPSGFSSVRLKPGYAQRMAYIAGTGWCPLFGGTLVV